MIRYQRKRKSKKTLVDLYQSILLPRMIEKKMLSLLRQNKISKWFAGIGQEAISAGVTKAINQEEYMLPMHRNLGVFINRGIPLSRLFMQFQGKRGGFTKGRDRSFHFGTNEYNIVGMISHLGPQLAVGSGIALANFLNGDKKVTVAFSGEGGTSEGDFHEALNVASVWQLPVIFVIENNGYGLSTPVSEQYNCKSLVERGAAYGMEAHQIDGNNILEVYDTIKGLAESVRKKPRPILVECMTFRMHGHEEASGTKYVPKKLMQEWAKKDPVANYEKFLLDEGVLTTDEMEALKADNKKYIESQLQMAYNAEVITDETVGDETHDIYVPHQQQLIEANGKNTQKRFIDAVSDGLKASMEKHDNLVLMGQDIADYGGVFKVTDGFMETFGKHRVRNTPLCESAILGIALGLSIKGYKSMVEMQFADFVTCGFNQIVNNLAKSHYRWGQNADVVVRMPTGGGMAAGPFHSQSNEAWFFHVPGLKIVYPSNPYDAKGLLMAAIDDPNPVMYFEHKFLYRNKAVEMEVPNDAYTVEIGKAAIARAGEELSIITYGTGVLWAKNYVQEHNIDAEIVDLRTLQPLDTETIFQSVKKTGKAIVLHEDNLTGGIGGEIAALIAEHCFEYLDGPVKRVGALDTPVPFAPALEKNYMPNQRFEKALLELNEY